MMTATAAPAPRPKVNPFRAESITGLWDMYWGTSEGKIFVGSQGDMTNTIGQGSWRGHWRWQGRTFIMTEVHRDDGWDCPKEYRIEMVPVPGGWKGRAGGFDVEFFNRRKVEEKHGGVNRE